MIDGEFGVHLDHLQVGWVEEKPHPHSEQLTSIYLQRRAGEGVGLAGLEAHTALAPQGTYIFYSICQIFQR